MTEAARVARHGAIAYLEQHQARHLAEELRDHAAELERLVRMFDSVPRGQMQATMVALAESMRDVAANARQQVETARKLPDALIFDFVRHETLPKWRDAMEALGYEWDPVRLRYILD